MHSNPNMAMLVVSLYDRVALTHQPFFHQPTIEAAFRAAKGVTKTLDPQDFNLIIWGEWNERARKTPYQPYLEPVWYDLQGNVITEEIME